MNRRRLAILAPLLVSLAGCVEQYDVGVAAFEVGPHGAILWTHVVPVDPDARVALLELEVATDPGFQHVVARRLASAEARFGFTARAELGHLAPATRYHYRFTGVGRSLLEKAVSPQGTFRTAPPDNEPAPVRFVISGDSNYGFTSRNGLDFFVLSAAAREDADFFLYLGDTVYTDSGIVPPDGRVALTLDEYRITHQLTRSDPHLQELLASLGTFAVWDDHEVTNDYAGETVDPARFANGAQAFFEWLPPRERPLAGPFDIVRRVRWGSLLELFLLDGRQFRSAEQFCNETLPDGPQTAETLFSPYVEDEQIAALVTGPFFPAVEPLLTPSDPDCVDTLLRDPDRVLLGPSQMLWLEQALLDSPAALKVIASNTPISNYYFLPYDRWEGYAAERQALLDFLAANFDPKELLVLTTDFHDNRAFARPEFTEVIVGPIATSTFGQNVVEQVPPEIVDAVGQDVVFVLLDLLLDAYNGQGSQLASEPDAFSYAVVDVWEEAGATRVRVVAKGDPDYADGANDPSRVAELFTVEFTVPGGAACSQTPCAGQPACAVVDCAGKLGSFGGSVDLLLEQAIQQDPEFCVWRAALPSPTRPLLIDDPACR